MSKSKRRKNKKDIGCLRSRRKRRKSWGRRKRRKITRWEKNRWKRENKSYWEKSERRRRWDPKTNLKERRGTSSIRSYRKAWLSNLLFSKRYSKTTTADMPNNKTKGDRRSWASVIQCFRLTTRALRTMKGSTNRSRQNETGNVRREWSSWKRWYSFSTSRSTTSISHTMTGEAPTLIQRK